MSYSTLPIPFPNRASIAIAGSKLQEAIDDLASSYELVERICQFEEAMGTEIRRMDPTAATWNLDSPQALAFYRQYTAYGSWPKGTGNFLAKQIGKGMTEIQNIYRGFSDEQLFGGFDIESFKRRF